jgi:hypothetical protein
MLLYRKYIIIENTTQGKKIKALLKLLFVQNLDNQISPPPHS